MFFFWCWELHNSSLNRGELTASNCIPELYAFKRAKNHFFIISLENKYLFMRFLKKQGLGSWNIN